MELLFATGNPNKVREIRALLPEGWQILSLQDMGFTEEIPETASTLAGNAELKAQFLYEKIGKDVLAEDTGLEVDALGGEPGVYSARYAGPGKDMEQNIALLLSNLDGVQDRKARFKTVVALFLEGEMHLFTGTLEGQIGYEKRGEGGFGYDPVFVLPDGRTLAELSLAEKSSISHRGKAVKLLLEFLQEEQRR